MFKRRPRRMNRAEAISAAIDISEPGDTIDIHGLDCTDAMYCVCIPKTIYIDGDTMKAPMGFRMRKDDGE